jgi:hypothetical protein
MDDQAGVSTPGGPAGSPPVRDRWRFVPMVGWIRSYQRRWLKDDLIAGFAVAALIVPKNLGYAGIAGIPLQNGLYAAAAGAILYAVFGTSRQSRPGRARDWPPWPRARSPWPGSRGSRMGGNGSTRFGVLKFKSARWG